MLTILSTSQRAYFLVIHFLTFRGHSSFVNSAIYSKDGTQVLSASSDGTVRLWDIRTSDCLISFRCDEMQSSSSHVLTKNILMWVLPCVCIDLGSLLLLYPVK